MAALLEQQLEALDHGDHVCLIYQDAPERLSVVVPFFREGLRRNECCVHVADAGQQAELVAALAAAGVDVHSALDRGALRLPTPVATYLTTGAFDAQEMIRFLQQTVEEAAAQGHTGLRTAGEMSWALDAGICLHQVMEYEAQLCGFFEANRVVSLCHYDRSRFSAETVRSALRTHPTVISGCEVLGNPFYEAPGMALEDPAGVGWPRVDWMIGQLERARREDDGRRELVERLARKGAALEAELRQRERAEALIRGQKEVLELMVRGAPLRSVLEALARTAEAESGPDTVAGILLLDADGVTLRHGGAPSLPDEYNQAIDGVRIHPDLGSCAAAAARGEVVIVEDLATHPNWTTIRHLPLGQGLRAAWSMPIFSSAGTVLGTFGIYYRTPRGPSARDRETIEVLSRTAGVAIERLRAEAEKERLEEHLRRRAEELLDMHRRKDEFLAMLAHELRNPLAPIALAAEILRQRGTDERVVTRQREVIDRNARHLRRLVDDLLEVARINEGKIELRKERMELASVLEQAAASVRPLVKEHAHTLAVTCPDRPVYLQADPTRLAQVLVNLLNNAVKYTERGGSIHLAAEAEGESAVLRVRDNGRGIDPQLLPTVFDLFVQGSQDLSRSEGGLGIGLTLVKRLVELHGGSISVESGPELGGTEFTIRLPAETASDSSYPGRSLQDGATAEARQPRRVLVVEDNRDAAETLARLLDIWGHEVRVVHDGGLAETCVEDYQPEVVLLDLGLPGVDGIAVAERLREREATRELTLIAVTGYSDAERAERARQAGFDDYLIKPVDPRQLQALLEPRPASSYQHGGLAPRRTAGVTTTG